MEGAALQPGARSGLSTDWAVAWVCCSFVVHTVNKAPVKPKVECTVETKIAERAVTSDRPAAEEIGGKRGGRQRGGRKEGGRKEGRDDKG
eukprot:3134578-Rhodomonas_salina.1